MGSSRLRFSTLLSARQSNTSGSTSYTWLRPRKASLALSATGADVSLSCYWPDRESCLQTAGLGEVQVTFLHVNTYQLRERQTDRQNCPALQQSVFFNPFSNTADSFLNSGQVTDKQSNVECCWRVSFCSLSPVLTAPIPCVQRRNLEPLMLLVDSSDGA